MGFLAWEERMIRKLSKRNFTLAIWGKILFAFAIGSLFSGELVRYSLGILLVGVILLIYYTTLVWNMWFVKKKIGLKEHIFGWIAMALVVLFFGIQTPQLKYNLVLLVVAIALVVPGTLEFFQK